jgi:hypothetical protein
MKKGGSIETFMKMLLAEVGIKIWCQIGIT